MINVNKNTAISEAEKIKFVQQIKNGERPIEDTIQPDLLICLEDGKRLKMLKRHLLVKHSLSPESYRKKWGLPDDYPMVAPDYAKQRANLAEEFKLYPKS